MSTVETRAKLVTKEELPKDSILVQLNKLQDDFEKTKDSEERQRIRAEILSIKREYNRTKQYASIMDPKLTEGKNSLDAISAADLMRIDKECAINEPRLRRGEFLSKSFLYKRTVDKKDGTVSEEPSDGKDLKE